MFGNSDIYINENCNSSNNCSTNNDGTKGYECHPQYKKSLFVNTDGPDNRNAFNVLDYEVYCIDYKDKYTIDHLCKYPDIIMEYIETKDISEESLKQVDDEQDLLKDLNSIHCYNNDIQMKILRYLKDPSELLSDTKIVSQQYDDKLREWLGDDYKWKMIYRASEHRYTTQSFHECCNYIQGPTLIVIKSTNGCIFGGYTTQSWSGNGIYYDI